MIRFHPIAAPPLLRPEALSGVWAQYPEVLAGYLFGSYARGQVTPLSDVDLAYWLDPCPADPAHRVDLTLRLEVDLCRAVGTDEVDAVLLNFAPPTLQYAVLAEGRRLFSRDPEAVARVEAGVVRRYLDLEYLFRQRERLAAAA